MAQKESRMCDNNCENCVCNQEVQPAGDSEFERLLTCPIPEEWESDDGVTFFEELGDYKIGTTKRSMFVAIEDPEDVNYFGLNTTYAVLNLPDEELIAHFPGLTGTTDLDWLKESLKQACEKIEAAERG
jgi:hypothetical protein